MKGYKLDYKTIDKETKSQIGDLYKEALIGFANTTGKAQKYYAKRMSAVSRLDDLFDARDIIDRTDDLLKHIRAGKCDTTQSMDSVSFQNLADLDAIVTFSKLARGKRSSERVMLAAEYYSGLSKYPKKVTISEYAYLCNVGRATLSRAIYIHKHGTERDKGLATFGGSGIRTVYEDIKSRKNRRTKSKKRTKKRTSKKSK